MTIVYINFRRILMQFLNSILYPIRSLVIVFACALLVLSNVLPASAAGTGAMGAGKSKPTDGTEQLKTIEKRAEDVAKADPYDLDMKATQERTQGGLNEVQGAADQDKMHRPSNSQDAKTVRDQLKGAFETATGQD
jgi:hypothetical protein